MKRMIIVLTSVMVLSGLILAFADTVFQPKIQANQQKALETSLAATFPNAKSPKFTQLPTSKMQLYKGTDHSGKLLGYAVGIVTTGYGGSRNPIEGLGPHFK